MLIGFLLDFNNGILVCYGWTGYITAYQNTSNTVIITYPVSYKKFAIPMICSKAGGDAWALTQRTISAWWNTQFEINYWNHSAVGKGIGSNWISIGY